MMDIVNNCMAAKTIPDDIKAQVEEIVKQFNKQKQCLYKIRFKGKYLYLDRRGYFGNDAPICRLKYTGDMKNWEFAIYKYSSERYDATEWFFPGSGYIDGTIEGALQAGLEAYPD